MADRDVTTLLIGIRSGDGAARERLYARVYDELRALAAAKMRAQGAGGAGGAGGMDVDATGLVHDAFLKLLGDEGGFENRRHFFGAAARAVQQVLIDKARAANALRRGGGLRRVDLVSDTALVAADGAAPGDTTDWEGLHHALSELDRLDEREAEVVRLKFFAGLSEAEIAGLLGVDERTVSRDWRHARAWLAVRLERHERT
ncbi:MAG: sigma-70 family RNA polymerase sigma factor [Chloroflexi bacterium]|nr:sigma-70 family RNA polymerase sigma factor [Chloroflexota bacterium]